MIFLHGANSGGAELQPFVDAMRPYARVRTPDWLGHGGRPIPPRMTVRDLADDVIAWMDREGVDRDVVGGYSLGGTIALAVARHYPQRVSGVVAFATKHWFDAPTIARWKYLASPDRVARVRYSWGTRVDELTRLHAPNDWKAVLDANTRFFDTLLDNPPLPEADLRAIQAPVLVVSSNVDHVVPWAETMAFGRALPKAHVAMFFGLAHPLRNTPLLAIARTIREWLDRNGLRA